MSAINFVVRDGAGNIQNGVVAGEGAPSSIIVGAGADVSLNLTRGQIVAYTRQGQALEITLLDGRVIVIEGYFTAEGVAENQLFISADGFLTEVNLMQGAGEDYYANYAEAVQGEKFALNDDLYFMRGADVMMADAYAQADDDVGMLAQAFGAGLAPIFGWGGAAAAGAAVVGGIGGGGDGGPDAPDVAVTNGTSGAGDVVNEDDYSDGVELGGTATAGATVEVTVEGVTKTVTAGDDGTWEVVYQPGELPEGTYETEVSVTATNEGGSTTATDTLVVDTELEVTFDNGAVGGDGVVNAVEGANGVTLTGTVEAGSSVVVTIEGVDYAATVTGSTWSVDVAPGVIGEGEFDQTVTVTATDGVGNVEQTSSVVVIDTITSVSLTGATGGADGVVNGVEHDGGVTLTGTAQPGASVVVTMGTLTQTVTATGSGTWSASWTSAQVPTGETTLDVSITATDAAGNTASTSGSVEIDTYVNELTVTSDTIGGSDAVVNFDESGQPITVTGSVEPGSTVVVTLHQTSQTASVDANGNWTVTFPAGALPGGDYATSMTVTATDAAMNESSITEAVQVDTVVGDVALSSAPIELDDVINFDEASDGVWISGTATPGLLVTVGFGGTEKTVYSDAQGKWSVQYSAGQVPADTASAQITASISDAAGNFKEVSDTVAIDTIVENFAFSSNPVEGNDVINHAEAQDGVVLTGTVEPNSTVVVEFGGETQTVTATGNGSWTANFSSGSVNADEYIATMTATATDPAGNVKVITDTVQVDTIVNTLTMTTPVEGDNVVNAAEAADGITLVGTVEQGSTVMVTFNNVQRQATVDANGNWSVTYDVDEIGSDEYDAQVTIAATDAHGNTSEISNSVAFEVDTVAPDAPMVESVTIVEDGVGYIGTETTGNDVTVSQVDANHNVTELADEGDGVALPWGETLFNFDPALSDGTHLVVTEGDAAGNTNSTYLVLEETGTNAVDLEGLDGFEIGAIDLSFAKDAELVLDSSALEGLADTNNDLVIHGGADDSVTLDGATVSGSTMIDGKAYDIYSMGDDGTVFIEDGIDVSTSVI